MESFILIGGEALLLWLIGKLPVMVSFMQQDADLQLDSSF